MKNITFLFLFIFAAYASIAQTTNEESIKKICESETRAWLEADATTFNNCWLVRPYTRITVSTEDGQTIQIGAEQIKSAQPNAMGNGGSFVNSNYLIHIEGNSAWATYDEVKIDVKGEKHPSFELRLLEKVNGAWKIVGMSIHHYKAQ